jgi:hypothetical protein
MDEYSCTVCGLIDGSGHAACRTVIKQRREIERLQAALETAERERDESDAAYVKLMLRTASPGQLEHWAEGDPVDALGFAREPSRLGRLVIEAAKGLACRGGGCRTVTQRVNSNHCRPCRRRMDLTAGAR